MRRSMKHLLALAALFAALSVVGSVPAKAQETQSAPAAAEEPNPLWRWSNFVILAVGLGYLLGKFLPPVFVSRDEEIRKGIADAQALKQDADKRAAEVDARLKTLGGEIEKFRAGAKAEMQREGERIRQETASQIARLEQQARQEIQSASAAAERELKNHAANLALELAAQKLRAQAGAGLVDSFIRDLGHQDVARKELSN